jgi:hypothetical protein
MFDNTMSTQDYCSTIISFPLLDLVQVLLLCMI